MVSTLYAAVQSICTDGLAHGVADHRRTPTKKRLPKEPF